MGYLTFMERIPIKNSRRIKMRINHNISAINTFRQFNANTARASKSMEKLSSGLRINRAADDAAGLSISEKMRSEIAGISQKLRNTQDQISFYQTAEGALNEVSDMLVRMKELLTQFKNPTYTTDDQGAIKAEITELVNTIGVYDADPDVAKGILGTTAFNGKLVFETNFTFDQLTDAANPTNDNIDAALTQIDTAIGQINSARAQYGAQQNRLEHEINNDSTYHENLQAAESRIRDVDMAEEMMEYTKNNILVQAAQAMLAQANAQPQGILQLLQ
jgi:flagellin